ncbi:hypothetical protein [Nocardia sp. NPDC051981]|uniref:hypothetical protein n=1 Tax=Nocardia sp. NPDC051981 TaxID=3155417 RepID=UPI003433D5BA
MAVSVYAKSRDEALRCVRYVAGHQYYFGAADQHHIRIPATVLVDFGAGSLELDMEDARALMFGLAVALVEDAVALKDSPLDPKAVA